MLIEKKNQTTHKHTEMKVPFILLPKDNCCS